jgi:predicted permease
MLGRRLRARVGRAGHAHELADEMAYHVEMLTRDGIARGLSLEDARAAALRQFGNRTVLAEEAHEMWSLGWLDACLRDARVALRALRRTPAFAIVAILTFALGIGANAAVFSVVHAVLLRALPYEQPDQLVRLYETEQAGRRGSVSPANFRDWRAQSRAFAGLAAYVFADVNLQRSGEPERLVALATTANFFSLLGARPLVGRTFLPDEDDPARSDVIVISERLWRDRFGASPTTVGSTVTLDGEPYTVIGVMPASFAFPAGDQRTDIWAPLGLSPERAARRGSHFLAVIGRLRPDATFDAAQTEMHEIGRRLERAYPRFQAGRNVQLVPLRQDQVGRVRPALLALFGAAGLVLLIACVNVASLLLARSAAREQELAVRAALGASRGRIAGQLLVESLVLAVIGGAAGIGVARLSIAGLVALGANSIPRIRGASLDGAVLAFLLASTLLTGIIFGLGPAVAASRATLNDTLKRGAPGAGGARRPWGRRVLVTGEIALALMLLAGAGLLIRTVERLHSVDVGLDPTNVLTMHVSPSTAKYPDQQSVDSRFYDPVLARVAALPGVRAVGWISLLPVQDSWTNGPLTIPGHPVVQPSDVPRVEERVVSPGYFAAMRIPIRAGRNLGPQDVAVTSIPSNGVPAAPLSALINEALARRYFAGTSPIGRQVTIGDSVSGSPVTIVGIVGDVRQSGLDRAPQPTLYMSLHQAAALGISGRMVLVVRTREAPEMLVRPVRRAIQAVDPDQPVFDVRTMTQVLADSIGDRRTYLSLLVALSAVALVLAAAGIYGVISYLVTQRTCEIGIRMALGAGYGSVLRLVLRQGLTLVVAGIVIGLGGALLLTRVLRSMLYGVQPTDPLTLGVTAGVLMLIALAASAIPARRAARVDPVRALRADG